MDDSIIVVATPAEFEIAEKWYKGHEIMMTGVGGINIIESLSHLKKDTPIINFGYAGSNKIPVGTIVNIKHVEHYHPHTEYDEGCYEIADEGRICLTADEFVTEYDSDAAVVFDMELAYICALGFSNIKSVKIISDNLSEKEYEESINGCDTCE